MNSMIYIGTVLIFAIMWLMSATILPISAEIFIIAFFAWVVLGQTYINLVTRIVSLLHTPKPKTNAQTDHLPNHYKATFSRKARVHFLGVWFVTTSKTCVQAFAS
jgi:hypothetical protein